MLLRFDSSAGIRRVFCAVIAGCIAGILGLTGWSGALFYLFSAALVSVFLVVRAGFRIRVKAAAARHPAFQQIFFAQEYFPSAVSVFTGGLFQGVMVGLELPACLLT